MGNCNSTQGKWKKKEDKKSKRSNQKMKKLKIFLKSVNRTV